VKVFQQIDTEKCRSIIIMIIIIIVLYMQNL